MNPYNLDYFITIAQCGSLTKAAEKLYVSQPSLSQYVKRLEKHLGTELFDHSTSPLKLTYSGERYYQYVLQARQLEENIQKEILDIRNQTRGQLKLGVALWRGACLLPDVFPDFHQQYPDIRLELLEGRFVQLQQALLNDEIDLAVANRPRNMNYDKLVYEVIQEERILLAAPTLHPYVQALLKTCSYTRGMPVAPLELLSRIPLILTKSGQSLTYEVMRFLTKNHIEPNVLMETGNLTTAINLTARGIACTFVPEEGAKVCQHPGAVTYFALDCPDLVWDLVVVYRKDTYLNNISRLFIEALKNLQFGA